MAKGPAVTLKVAPAHTSSTDTCNLAGCIEEVRTATLNSDPGPADPTDFQDLITRLDAARTHMPPLYRTAVVDPFKRKIEEMGERNFNNILLKDPDREGTGGLMMDIAHSVLQNGEKYQPLATDAFQEVICDLYDGFLSAEDRHGAKPPDQEVIPPLAKWGCPEFGPYTWPVDATSSFDVGCGIVNLPPSNASQGLLAWTALAHETAGHDIIHANDGLEEEMQEAVHSALSSSNRTAPIADYWSERIDETASDVFGILNMGPLAGIGLIGYFRGLNAAWEGTAHLRNDGPADDPHPADILRGFLASSTVKLLAFQGAAAWAKTIADETRRDVTKITVERHPLSVEDAILSAETVVKAITHTRFKSLENHRFIDIQNWHDQDEKIVAQLQRTFRTVTPISQRLQSGIYAAHAVAAAATAALAKGADIKMVFGQLLRMLKVMHDANPSWGPLYVRHPGNIFKCRTYIPAAEQPLEMTA